MIAQLTNHLWQSTIFAAVAALLTFALRRQRAHVRYWVWLAASVKFLVPFALLITLGSWLARIVPAPVQTVTPTDPGIALVVAQLAEPYRAALPAMSPAHWNDSPGVVEKQLRLRQSFQSACPISGKLCGPRLRSV